MSDANLEYSASTEDAVLVEHEDAPELKDEGDQNKEPTEDQGTAIQIVSIGTREVEYAFTFNQERFNKIISTIPVGWKVSVVSVVGAFRTGKSFLLSWFLRYLHHLEQELKPSSISETTTEGVDGGDPWYNKFQTLGSDGFDWKGGTERNTAGIWMWNRPFFITPSGSDQPIAVLLVDTQGMFDHETTMALTASIFGFSTLLSSYQIYNVDKRIQEDNLQHLALFSEFARMANANKNDTDEIEEAGWKKSDEETNDSKSNEGGKGISDKEEQPRLKFEDVKKSMEENKKFKNDKDQNDRKPFQLVEFLVRDWQHFDDDDESDDDDDENMDYNKMERSMSTYLEKVIAERDATDLQETRDQIVACFEIISCYGLCHPGFAATKKKYTGDVSKLEKTFLVLLDRYCRRVFDPSKLAPKRINGRELTAAELATYVSAYADMFRTGANFPEASTMLQATSTANNSNAVSLALEEYKQTMDRIAGPTCSNYLNSNELEEEHLRHSTRAMEHFDEVANFGNRKAINLSRNKMVEQMDGSFAMYKSLNDGRNPLKGLETILLPLSIAFISYLAQWVTDLTCAHSVCKAGSDLFAHTFGVVMWFLAILACTKMQQIKQSTSRIKAAYDMFMEGQSQKKNN